MCLFTIQKEPKIADKDIIVYKVGKILILANKRIFISPYQNYSYIKNELQREIKIHSKNSYIVDGYVVNEGYHAYLTFRRAFFEISSHDIIGKFIIPKGSKYYIGDDGDGDIVSSQIIYKGKINIFNKIKLLICGK